MKKIVIASLFLALLAGCATKPIPTSEAKPVPDSRIFDRSYLDARHGTGEIVVKRDAGITIGGGCNHRLFLDGVLIAEIDTGEKIILRAPEGKHIVSSWPKSPCSGGMVEAEIVIDRAKATTLRVGYNGFGDFGIYPTAF